MVLLLLVVGHQLLPDNVQHPLLVLLVVLDLPFLLSCGHLHLSQLLLTLQLQPLVRLVAE